VTLPRHVGLVGDTPHATLFPRMAGVIHHGGSGTTHNVARAGVPQGLTPQIIDQYYWGQRVYELGIGPEAVPFSQLTERKLAGLLRGVLESRFARQARIIADLMNDDGAAVAAEAIDTALSGRSAFGTGPDTAKVVPIQAIRGAVAGIRRQ